MFCPRCHRQYDAPGQRFCPHDGAPLDEGSRMSRIRVRPTGKVGQIIGCRYAIRGFVGAGGMARVYVAEDTFTGEPVAVKILDREKTQNRDARERFLREVEVSATIEHPNIVKILDAGERADRSPYIVLEFLFGESLGELLRRDGSVEEAFALPLIQKVASALAAAHRAGILHRDIKPDNLFLLGERGDPYGLKVVDFGMAKFLEGAGLTGVGQTLGTIAYMAPEQAIADVVDPRTDVYGLGVVMFRMLTGRLPFGTPNDAELIAQHLFVAPPRPRDVRPDLDPRLEAVILTAMRKRPENRYPSMQALLEDIERILGERGGDLLASAPSPRAPDLYVPVIPFAQTVAKALRAKLQASG